MSSRPRLHNGAPAERLAAVRILTGAFAVIYLVGRAPAFLALRDRDADGFAGVGALAWLDRPPSEGTVLVLMAVAMFAGVAFVAGAWFRVSGPLFALTILALTTYRSSWGQLLHFENLLVLHLLIIGFAASADAWAFDARRAAAPRREHDYASPLRLLCIIVVVAYVIAGLAKLRYGGAAWATGDTLRNHIAYTATRLDILGGSPSPLARLVVTRPWMLPPMAAASILIELAAPIALLGGRLRTAWVAAAWLMHLTIAALMLVVFPYPLFLVAFAPFFEVERTVDRVANETRKRLAERTVIFPRFHQ